MGEGKTMFSIGDLTLEEVFEGKVGMERLWGGQEQERSRERGCNEEWEIFWTLVKTAEHSHCVPGEPGFHLEAYASSCLNLLYSLK